MTSLIETLSLKKTGIAFEELGTHFEDVDLLEEMVLNIKSSVREFDSVSKDILWAADRLKEELDPERVPTRSTFNIDSAIARRHELFRSIENQFDLLRWAMRANEK